MPARGGDGAPAGAALNLRVPFVYRKYTPTRWRCAARIRQDWQRRASARNGIDSANNIKLGDGGIREIEFVVQLAQLIRADACRPCSAAAAALHAARRHNAQRLSRPLPAPPHALQYREDEQTHLLRAPAADAADKEEPDEQCELAGQIRQAFGDEADDLRARADTLMGSHRVRSCRRQPPPRRSRCCRPPCAPRGRRPRRCRRRCGCST